MGFNSHLLFFQSERRREIFTTIRVSFFMLFVCLLQLHATDSYSQEAKIHIASSTMSLRQLFANIEKQSDFLFFFVDKDVDGIQVKVNAQNQLINTVLNDALKNTSLSYTINDRHVTITRKEEVKLAQQTPTITGTIRDVSGIEAIGVSIKVKNSTRGTVSDLDGKFTIQATQGETLVFSYIGYKTQEIVVGSSKVMNVVLIEDTKSLDEVVVVGYGSQKKVNLTGAVTSVKMDDVLGNRPVASSIQVLEGSVPGLQISRASGKPGAANFINIRGVTSINNPETGPLVLVDHVPMNLDMIDPNDIESVTVLKDAAAASIYGSRAAFGIILVTTKKAGKNAPIRVNYSNNFAFSNPASLPHKLDPYSTVKAYSDLKLDSYYAGQTTADWLKYMDDYYNKGLYPEGYAMDGGLRYNLAPTDVYKDMMDKTGFQQQHNISLSGGSDKSSYRLSFGMVDENGILYSNRDRYTRYNATTFVSMDATKWLTGQVDIRYADSKTSTPQGSSEGSNIWAMAKAYQPMAPLGYGLDGEGLERPYNSPRNLLMLDDPKIGRENNIRLLGRAIVKPFQGMEIIGEYSFYRRWWSDQVTRKEYKTLNSNAATQTSGTALSSLKGLPTSYNMTQTFSTNNAINIYGTYKKTLWEDHNFSLMGGFNQEYYYDEKLAGGGINLIIQDLPSISMTDGSTPSSADAFNEYAVRGVFYRLNYDYKGKYLVEVNGRYDGSSRFPKNDRFGFFPSFSVGWRVAEEAFFESVKEIVSNLKPRISWGQIGNQNVSNYGYLPTMTPGKVNNDTPFKDKGTWILPGKTDFVTSMAAPGLVSSNYTWETVQTLDVGLDIGLFNNQLEATFDWYQRDTKNMLARQKAGPGVLGTDYPFTNAAALQTKGFELSVQWKSKIGNDIRYNIGFNLYDSESTITKYDNPTGLLLNGDPNASLYLREGLKYGEIWGYETDRLYTKDDFDATGKLKAGIPFVRGTKPNPGDILYKNLNGPDKKTNPTDPDVYTIDNGTNKLGDSGDMKIIGNNSARLLFGINGGFSWKNFDLSFFINGVGKRDMVMPEYTPISGTFVTSVFDYQGDYWREDHTDSYWPRIYGSAVTGVDNNNGANTKVQTKYLQDGSFVRLKNITIGYNLPKSACNKLQIQNLRIFVGGENLYTWHHLPKGYYPDSFVALPGGLKTSQEIRGDGDGNGNWSYPLMRQFSTGLNLTF